ncbi:MAG: amidohydrolase family protein [Chloroflexi bacterium]|nr:amidohydrolase family protein [Chloroflexota bacterium]
MPVIDVHGHTIPRRGFLNRNGETAATPAELVQIMDRLGIDKMVVLPLTSPEALHFVQSNEEALEACAQHPSRFIPFCSVDPRIENNSPTHDFTRILEYYRSLGCKGVGEVVANLPWDDPRVQQLFAGSEAVGLPLTFHCTNREFNNYGLIDEPGLGGLERALRRFPKLQFLGHSPGFWTEVGPVDPAAGSYPKGPVLPGGRVPQLLRDYPNLWGDLSAGSGYNAVSRDLEWGYAFLEEFQDRLLFGLDICAPSQEASRGRMVTFMRHAVETGKISRTAYDKIMGGNAVRLLRLEA